MPSDAKTAPNPGVADLPPLPADAHADQSIQLGGRALKYTATVGTIPVYSADGSKKTAEVLSGKSFGRTYKEPMTGPRVNGTLRAVLGQTAPARRLSGTPTGPPG